MSFILNIWPTAANVGSLSSKKHSSSSNLEKLRRNGSQGSLGRMEPSDSLEQIQKDNKVGLCREVLKERICGFGWQCLCDFSNVWYLKGLVEGSLKYFSDTEKMQLTMMMCLSRPISLLLCRPN